MKKLFIILFTFISSFSFGQGYDFQALCVACAEQEGFYCGDDPANWTQYSPNGCVPNGLNGLFYLNDGWADCVNEADEQEAEPTSMDDCAPPQPECDTVYVDIPVIEYVDVIEYIDVEIPFYIYETIIQFDTIVETEYITTVVIDTVIEEVEVFVPEYIYVTDTVYAEVLDTMFIDVIEYVIEYVEIINTEYVDCATGLPCNSAIEEIIDNSKGSSIMYNLLGQPIKKPESIYIEDGQVKYLMN